MYGQEVRTGVTNWRLLQPYLPSEWMGVLRDLPPEVAGRVQEVRVRAGQPLTVSLPEGERYLCGGGVTSLRQRDLVMCSATQVEECFLRFCDHSVYAHEWELRQGYLAVPGGVRVGVAGTAVVRHHAVASVQAVTALCIRLPRALRGCAGWLTRLVTATGFPVSTLLVGEPSSGKTTLLRDLAAGLAALHHRVAVVDERGELAGVEGLPGCDVLLGYPKAEGVRQAVRCMAPEVVLFDELGDEEETAAVASCAHAGVAVVATLHGRTTEELERRPLSRLLLEQRAFRNWVFLSGRRHPGIWSGVYQPEVCCDGIRWLSADFGGGNGDGDVCRSSFASASDIYRANPPLVADLASAGGVCSPPYERAVATIGGNTGVF